MNKPDRAGIRRRFVGSRTDAKANLAAVNARNDSVVFVRIRWVICNGVLPPSDVDVGSIPSKSDCDFLSNQNQIFFFTFSTNTNNTPNSCNHWNTLEKKTDFYNWIQQTNKSLLLQDRSIEEHLEEQIINSCKTVRFRLTSNSISSRS